MDAGSGFELASCPEVPMRADDSNAVDPFCLDMTTADGRTHRIEATMVATCSVNVIGPNEMGFGADHRPVSTQALWNGYARYE